jgi:hypothetical protein
MNSLPDRSTPSGSPGCAKTRRARILRVLIDARGALVPLPEIEACAALYNARLFELRRLGFHIENRTERDDAGAVHSRYRLVNSPAPAESPAVATPPLTPAAFSSSAGWYERQTGQKCPSLKPPDELHSGHSLFALRKN